MLHFSILYIIAIFFLVVVATVVLSIPFVLVSFVCHINNIHCFTSPPHTIFGANLSRACGKFAESSFLISRRLNSKYKYPPAP